MVSNRLFIRLASALLVVLSCWSVAASADPPARVARLSLVEGSASFSPARSKDWAEARLNRPLTSGDRLWVDRRSRVELHSGSTALRLGGQTSLEILELGDRDTQLQLGQGRLSIRVHQLARREVLEIDTPNLAFVVHEPGEYRFDVSPDGDSTTITVREGAGTAYGNTDNRYEMEADQQVRFLGDELETDFEEDAPRRDAFDRWVAARDEREAHSRSRRYLSPEIAGYADLDDYGAWREVPRYGAVWVPRVEIGWAPYHFGHWAWIAPWGWTWVDDAPWGFAPFHYGRWAHLGGAWCWVPGPIVPRPVYAPALVAFVGGSSGNVNWGVSLSAGVPGVAWFALAPGERYEPPYRASQTYLSQLNRHERSAEREPRDTYLNRQIPGAIAVVPRQTFIAGQAVQAARTRLAPERERQMRSMPAESQVPLAPAPGGRLGATRRVEAPQPAAARRDFVERRHPDRPADGREAERPDALPLLPRRGPTQELAPGVRPDHRPLDREPGPIERERTEPVPRPRPEERRLGPEPGSGERQRREPAPPQQPRREQTPREWPDDRPHDRDAGPIERERRDAPRPAQSQGPERGLRDAPERPARTWNERPASRRDDALPQGGDNERRIREERAQPLRPAMPEVHRQEPRREAVPEQRQIEPIRIERPAPPRNDRPFERDRPRESGQAPTERGATEFGGRPPQHGQEPSRDASRRPRPWEEERP